MSVRANLQAYHPFTRLNRLLADIEPGPSPRPDGAPILLSLGEPQRQPPAFLTIELTKAASDWSRYPPPRGSTAYRQAAADWLQRRYTLPDSAVQPGGLADPERAILPVPGSREGLYFATLAVVAAAPKEPPPAVVMPNPFYHVYAGAAVASGAEPVFVSAGEDNGYIPDFLTLDPAILERTAYCTLCTPSNPQGAVASIAQMQSLIELARRYDFVVAFDECYSELYYGEEAPPGALQAAVELDGTLTNVLAFHSLSKRSSAPGLRCGFVVGDPRLIDELAVLLQVGGAGVPLPVQAAGARLWSDDQHVVETRAFYRENFAATQRAFGNRLGFHQPEAGFFLWLKVDDGEAACRALWQEAGIKVLPGAYMCADDADGNNPGRDYLRLALVHDPTLTEPAMARLADVLSSRS